MCAYCPSLYLHLWLKGGQAKQTTRVELVGALGARLCSSMVIRDCPPNYRGVAVRKREFRNAEIELTCSNLEANSSLISAVFDMIHNDFDNTIRNACNNAEAVHGLNDGRTPPPSLSG